MKLTSLQIEKFGARSNLQLDGLSDQLNVVYGPTGSGKTTIVEFIRWMIYGNVDDTSRRFLTGADVQRGGELGIIDGDRNRRHLHRHHDAVRGDRVRVTRDETDTPLAIDADRLTSVTPGEFGYIFCIGMDQPPSLAKLIDATKSRNLSLTYDQAQMQQLQDLTVRVDELRRDHPAWTSYESLDVLHDRRRQLQDDLQLAQQHFDERLGQLHRECDTIGADIVTDRRQLESLQAMLHRTETTIETRRGQFEQAADQVRRTRERWMESRHQEVAEIDHQIQQWHTVLDIIRQRDANLQTQRVQEQPSSTISTPTNEEELRAFLHSLGHQIDDVDQDLREWETLEDSSSEHGHGQYLRSVLGATLHSMRDDVHRLCCEVERQQANAKFHDLSREQDRLRRCESELNGLLEALSQRRQSLVTTPEYAESTDRRTVPLSETPRAQSWHRDSVSSENGAAHRDHDVSPIDPVFDAKLSHLIRRRDQLAAQARELETRINNCEYRLADLKAGHEGSKEARHRDELRRVLGDLDQHIAHTQHGQRHREEIESLERQIDELRRNQSPSEILCEASSLLHRLTNGAYRGIRIDDRGETWIEDGRGRSLRHSELSRGTRDHLYLSLALALVAAYRRHGIELPMVLSDVFNNTDTEHTQATAELLSHFASQGHQIVLFTRHEHVMQRFASLNAKLYTLRERARTDDRARATTGVARDLPPRTETYYLDKAPVTPTRPVNEIPATRSTEMSWRERSYDWVTHWDPPRRPSTVRLDVPPRTELPRTELPRTELPRTELPRTELPRTELPRTELPRTELPRTEFLDTVAPRSAALRPEVSRTEASDDVIREHSRLSDVRWLDQEHVDQLEQCGIENVQQLLETNPEDVQRHLASFEVAAASVDRWQSRLSFQCYVGVSDNDAELLVTCGVDDPEELAYIDVSQLHRRIEDFLSDPKLRDRYGSIARFERSRLSRWIQAARRSHYRRQRWPQSRSGRLPKRTAQPIIYRGESTERIAPRARRIEPTHTVKVPAPSAVPEPVEQEQDETLRFFLELSDPIVDAPSIGPKTAERFHAVGVTTISELLGLDPTDAAKRIGYRRITGNLIRTWQLQTSLVCRVPNLRGHDAQLLVACDVPGPEQLAKMEPGTLLAQVETLLSKAEGKRILRGSKSPDSHEITRWIRWAKSARELQLT